MAFGIKIGAPSVGKDKEVQLDLTPLGARQTYVPPETPVTVSRIFLEPEEELRRRVKLRQPPRPFLLLAMAYSLGGLAPAFLDQGKRRFTWGLMTLVSVGVWTATVWWRQDLLSWIEAGKVPLLPWTVALGVITLMGVQGWSRAVYLAGRDSRFVPERLPDFLRHPIAVGLMGGLFPGAGYLIAGHPRRAAATAWMIGPMLLSALTLWQAEWLWNINRSSGAQGLPLAGMEIVFLVSAAVLLTCGLFYATSLFDAARLTSSRSGQRASARADWLGFAVVLVAIAFFATLAPVKLARNLDRLAFSMQHEEYRMIPLGMERAAMRLDPSRPRYVMRAAQLHDRLDHSVQSQTLRHDLRTRWHEYAELLLRQDIVSEVDVPLEPIGATDLSEGRALP